MRTSDFQILKVHAYLAFFQKVATIAGIDDRLHAPINNTADTEKISRKEQNSTELRYPGP